MLLARESIVAVGIPRDEHGVILALKEVRREHSIHDGAVLVVCRSVVTLTLFILVVLVMYALVLALPRREKVDAPGPKQVDVGLYVPVSALNPEVDG